LFGRWPCAPEQDRLGLNRSETAILRYLVALMSDSRLKSWGSAWGARGMAFRVLVTDPKIDDLALFEAAGRTSLEFDLREVGMPGDLPDDVLAACDAYCMFNVKPVGADMIDRMTRCRVLVRAGVGF